MNRPYSQKSYAFLIAALVFLAAGLTGVIFFSEPEQNGSLAAKIARSLDRVLNEAETEAASLIQHPNDNEQWLKVKNSFFLVDSARIKAWTGNGFFPEWNVVLEPFSIKLLQVSNGDFLIKKWIVTDHSFLLLVLPLHKEYPIVNNYLNPEWNETIFEVPVKIDEIGAAGGSNVCTSPDVCYFSISRLSAQPASSTQGIIFIFFLLSIICLLIYSAKLLFALHKQGNYQQTFLWLAGGLAMIRILLVELNFPNALVKFRAFDPQQFASSSFNASVGDLFINSLVVGVLCLYLFSFYTRFKITRRILRTTKKKQAVSAIACLLICFFALLFPYLYGEIIYHNSSISLEITQTLAFGETRIIAFVSLLLGCIISFLMIHVFIRLALRLKRMSGYSFLPLLLIAATFFLAFFLLTAKNYWITLGIGTVFFILLFAVNLDLSLSRLTFKSFLYFILMVIALALQATLSVMRLQGEKMSNELFRFGNNMLVDQDILGEYLLNENVQRIARDPFIQLRLSSPFLSKASVRQKIRLFYLNSYFDRYDVQIYLYNREGQPYDNLYSLNFAASVDQYQKENYKTIYPGIYFIHNPSSDATKKYLVIIPVKRFAMISGYVVMDLTLKKIIPQDVYPELLVDNRFTQYTGNQERSYAYFLQGKLLNSFGDYNYEKYFDAQLLSKNEIFSKGVRNGEYYHIAMEDKAGQVTVVTGKRYSLFFTITNFSFYFIAGLAVILMVLFVNGIIAGARGKQFNYSTRIQLYVYLAFFIPLVAVSITTLSLISRSSEVQLTKEYGDRGRILSEQIAAYLQQSQDGAVNSQSDFQNRLTELAKSGGVEASVYLTNGALLASSQPAIYQNHLVSHLISREAWNAIVDSRENSYIANEQIGKLHYNGAYAAIRSAETRRLLGVLSIPFFSSAASLEQSKINVLANILTVFVIVFILFSFLSFFVSKALTFPLRFITRSLQRTSLTETNQRIVWNSTDEIGLLANEYNRMVQNLEQSKAELVRSQKESAWREIAKQVAHEIKNPLTPMKLTLQQWERNLGSGDVSPERARKSIEILLTQLETLNNIAGSFSAFARMPTPDLQRIDVGALLKKVVDLHASLKEGSVTLLAAPAVYILGDEQLLGRIFANLILNGLQSGKENVGVTVTVSITVTNQLCIIAVKDTGLGIETWVRDKVFLPHFSTKKTGSGLGLAIVRQGIEQSGGSIRFETATGKGTTFFIEFPIAP